MEKVAFISGANRGIGFETSKKLAKHGLFPKPIRFHTGVQLWGKTIVKDWVSMRFKTEDWVTKVINSELF